MYIHFNIEVINIIEKSVYKIHSTLTYTLWVSMGNVPILKSSKIQFVFPWKQFKVFLSNHNHICIESYHFPV